MEQGSDALAEPLVQRGEAQHEDAQQGSTRQDAPLLEDGAPGPTEWDAEDDSEQDDDDAAIGRLTPFSRSPVLFFQQRFQAGSITGSVFTLVVAIVGAGTLSVPFGVQQCGLLLGIGLFAAGACIAFFSLRILVISSELSGVKSYPGIARALYGPWLGRLAQGSLLLNLYGTSISYIVAAGSMLAEVLQVVFGETDQDHVPYYLEEKFVMVMATVVVVVPLCLLRTMGALRYSSLIAVSCSIYLTIVVIIKYFSYCGHTTVVQADDDLMAVTCFWEKDVRVLAPVHTSPVVLADVSIERLLSAIPIVVYSYTCHPNVLPIFLELQKPTRRRMTKVVGRAIALAFVLYTFLGTFAYLTFKDQLAHSNGNFLNNDYHHDTTTLLGAMGMSMSVILAIPLFVNAFRATVYRSFAGERANPKEAPLLVHVSISLLMVGLALLPAILIKDISMVFQILGSTTNPVICYVLPALYLCKTAPNSIYYREKVVAVTWAVIIVIVSVLSLARNIQTWSDK